MILARHQASLHTLRLACVGLLVWIPWMAHVARGQGSISSTLGWVVLDVAELAALFTTARLLHHRDERVANAAMVSAALLISDASIDLVTSAQGPQQVLALAMAAIVEIPLALLCCWIATVIAGQATGGHSGPSAVRSLSTGAWAAGADAAAHFTVMLPQLARLGESTLAPMA